MTRRRRAKILSKAVDFLVKDEQGRVLLTSMVACLFARGVYTDELLATCLKAVGYGSLADNLGPVSRNIQQLRWKNRLATGFMPEEVTIPKRFHEITTVEGAFGQRLPLQSHGRVWKGHTSPRTVKKRLAYAQSQRY